MLKIGFSGTQEGLTVNQYKELKEFMTAIRDNNDGVVEAHHGDCIEADEKFHNIAKSLGFRIVIHPPSDDKKRAYCSGADEVRTPKPYLDRNKDIVDETAYLIAAPKSRIEELRSGTWSTIRYAKKQGKETVLIAP